MDQKTRIKLLFCLLFTFVLSVCAWISTSRSQQKVLHIGLFYGSNWDVPGTEHYAIFQAAIEKYEAEHPNVDVVFEPGIPSEDYSEWLSGQILKGEEPDVYIVLNDDFATLVSLGALQSLDSWISTDQKDPVNSSVFYQTAYQAGSYQGKQYALPFECNPTLMFVNKTLLKKEGIDLPQQGWTWEVFYKICKDLVKDTDGDGEIDQFGCFGYRWYDAVYSNGIGLFDENGRDSLFTDPRVIDAVNFTKNLSMLDAGHIVSANDFDLGRVAFRPMTLSEYRTYMPYPWRIKKYSDFEWNCIPMPAGPRGSNCSMMDTLMLGISARTKHKEESWEFLRLLTMDEEIQSLVFEDTAGSSVLKSVANSEKTMRLLNQDTPGDQYIDMSLLDHAIETSVIQESFVAYEEAFERADAMITSLFSREDDLVTGLFAVKKEVDDILQK